MTGHLKGDAFDAASFDPRTGQKIRTTKVNKKKVPRLTRCWWFKANGQT